MVIFLCGTFFSLIYFQDKNSFKRTNKAASITFLEIEKSVNQYTYEAPGYYLPEKRVSFFAFSVELVLICNECYKCKLVCTDTMNEWCKKLTMKTLT